MARFLTGPLERVDPVAGGTQLVVVTEDAESAVVLAQTVLGLTGMAGIELFPITSPRRAARIIAGRPVLAIAGSPGDLMEMIRGSHIKLQDVSTIVLAWADDLMDPASEASSSLDLLMTEIPKDAARVVVTANADARVDAFVERYLRRARRVDERDLSQNAEPLSLQYVTVSATNRVAALRRLLDDLDPPSAAIVVDSEENERAVAGLLRALGYSEASTVRVSRGDVAPNTHAVIFYGLPASRARLAETATAKPVTTVALVQPREVAELRRMAGGEVKPLTLSDSGTTARDRERAMRRELSAALESGLPAREILALEPLLERYDGIEIAGAALRLLERERAIRQKIEAAAAAAAPRPAAPSRPGFDRGSRDDRGGRSGPPRGMGRDSRPPRSDSRPPRSDSRPPRSDSRPPRSDSRPPRRDGPPGRDSSRGRDDRGRGGRPPRDR
ncbi:MAG TPA: DEAD/DEAH box helicase [Gemmatimonadaceae bacterium]|nr:DEAD/DEAH box helicase [Gemmatimonadaceae bacterium]